jgi:hypothetical protein
MFVKPDLNRIVSLTSCKTFSRISNQLRTSQSGPLLTDKSSNSQSCM